MKEWFGSKNERETTIHYFYQTISIFTKQTQGNFNYLRHLFYLLKILGDIFLIGILLLFVFHVHWTRNDSRNTYVGCYVFFISLTKDRDWRRYPWRKCLWICVCGYRWLQKFVFTRSWYIFITADSFLLITDSKSYQTTVKKLISSPPTKCQKHIYFSGIPPPQKHAPKCIFIHWL